MPEGDTVWLAARRLHEALAGRVLLASDFRVPQLATTDLAGSTVTGVEARGKHLLTRFAGGPGGEVTLHTHFRMDGSWHLYPDGRRWGGGPDWQVRVVLRVEGTAAVGYRLPVVELLPTDREHDVVGHLGPDVLGPGWDPTAATVNLLAAPEREVGDALLDQRVLAGVGNLYRAETCFVAGVTPFTPVGDLPHHGSSAAQVVAVAARLLHANRGRWQQSTTGDLRRGRDHWVFEQRRCLRCGTPVLTAATGDAGRERVAYWCPRCQRGPAPDPVPLSVLLPPTRGRTRYRP
ncbi:DNA-formamidopyrimidine glycosylase family protein [Aquipuribacter nitratireducens]|uniref:DNA-(apurinic or apyrimidinic site) lyase n=1 Tax=Aquipuribacter nitratireducens TaxID=650104 RepID=A0ABW0GIY7_9MICO